jgi:CRISPR-associated protein Cmr5
MTADTLTQPVTQTRSQQFMSQALQHVLAVQRNGDAVARADGGWCHTVPSLILANGLCQTVAFLEDKAKEDKAKSRNDRPNPRAQAARLVREHIAQVIGAGSPDRLTDQIGQAGLATYMHQTRTVLAAWVYYKRFAVSLLGVQPGEDATEDDR